MQRRKSLTEQRLRDGEDEPASAKALGLARCYAEFVKKTEERWYAWGHVHRKSVRQGHQPLHRWDRLGTVSAEGGGHGELGAK